MNKGKEVTSKEKLILALDVDTKGEVKTLVRELVEFVGIFKVGPRLFTRYGPEIVEIVKKEGGKVFYDAKFYDIPSVVEKAAEAVGEMGVDMFTLHTLGGYRMMKAAAVGAKEKYSEIKVIGVTVLTCLNSLILKEELGIERDLKEEVVHLAGLAKRAGLDGVVASSYEIKDIREALGEKFLLVVPGIRPRGAEKDDQQRVMTPEEAIRRGADFLVLGRPILKADSPREAVKKILKEIEAGR
ncbi:orotidine-5'-phosphate decarboxylase [Candidatus Aerophobetes bacterium]|uniref:Orotidine 5'-phosphate decarboxylase n=1 Tax=Aerophobetes bacterium TaxID=2030807 RepID=A0A662D2M2_UNCAE|nr:MAG: orotidine-5'-phosphate decarboxylase [Candidatus Aerophobetes bacterium]